MKWEYNTGFINFDGAEDYLNKLGEEGWELVSFEFPREDDRDPGTHCGYVMKRSYTTQRGV